MLKKDSNIQFETVLKLIDEEDLEMQEDEDHVGDFDAVLSNFSLHLNNNIDYALAGILSNLRPDGVFMGTVPGSKTLSQLRNAIYMAENERYGGSSQHVLKFPEANYFGNSLNRHKFGMSSVTTSMMNVAFNDIFELMEALQNWGLGNCLKERTTHYQQDLFLASAAIYQTFYKSKVNAGKIDAEFETLSFIGYKSAPNQFKKASKDFTLGGFKDFIDNDPDQETKDRVKFGSITEENVDTFDPKEMYKK